MKLNVKEYCCAHCSYFCLQLWLHTTQSTTFYYS